MITEKLKITYKINNETWNNPQIKKNPKRAMNSD
jgi:hypothetical protein